MNRTQYRQARRLFRDNGTHALLWMSATDRDAFLHLINQREDIYQDILFFYRSVQSIHVRLTFRHRALRDIRA